MARASTEMAGTARRWLNGRWEVSLVCWRCARLVGLPLLAQEAEGLVNPFLWPFMLTEVRILESRMQH